MLTDDLYKSPEALIVEIKLLKERVEPQSVFVFIILYCVPYSCDCFFNDAFSIVSVKRV